MNPSITKILLVDDDESLLRATRRLLGAGEPDWEILMAIDGQEAIELLQSETVAVVITDLSMPRVDGAALLRHLAEYHPETVRIVHSSLSGTTSELPRWAAHRLVTKPASPSHLLAIARWAVRQAAMLSRGCTRPSECALAIAK